MIFTGDEAKVSVATMGALTTKSHESQRIQISVATRSTRATEQC